MAVNNQITAPRVNFLDKDGRIAREWYLFLYNLYTITGSGTGFISVTGGGTGLGTIPTDGQLLIGNGTGYTLNTLGAGSGISVANGSGTITVANDGVLSFSGGTTGLTPVAAAVGVVVLDGTLIAANGGTGFASYAVGDLLYADTTTTLAKLADVATGNALISGGVDTAPSWGKIGLTTHVDGVLPIANGGTNSTDTPTAYGVSYGTGTAYAFTAAGTTGQILTATTGSAPTWAAPATNGDVVGPASATDNAVARFDLTTGKLIQNSTVIIDDNGNTSLNAVEFDITPATLPTAQGTLYWDNADNAQTLSLVMEGGNAIQQIGEEIYYRVKCSAAITEGQGVMLTGTVGASGGLTAAPASGLTKSTAYLFMGVATESGALNDWIYITSFGIVRGINTTGGAEAWVDGQILYYNPAVAGGLTDTEPAAPAAKIQVAAVVYAASNGSIFVRPRIGIQLDDLNDVESSSAATSDLLQYTSGGYWQHAAPSTVTGVGSVANAVTFNNGGAGAASGTTFDGSVARTISYNTVGAQVAGTYVTSVTGTAPVVSSGGVTPAISMAAANTSTNGYLTSTDWNTFNSKQPAGTYVTAVSVASANGLAGTSSGGATPALTLSTSITGILKGNGTAISAATSGTDYAPATSGTSILYGNGSGGFSNVTVGSGLSFAAGTLAATTSAPSAPVTKTANFTVADTEVWLINNKTGSTCTATLPAAALWSGRVLYFQNYQAQTLVSASSNVVPLAGGSAATSILLASSGDSATLVSDGTNWLMTQYIPNNILLLG
jgi:hypothetical protein